MSLLIAVEGTDASGKKTQSDMLSARLKKEGMNVLELSFPDYDSPSSTLVKMYLGGEFGNRPEDTNPYAASSFFAVDRYASYKKFWEKAYKSENCVIILNRYTTSNAIHQLAKINGSERDDFLEWLYDFEFVKLGIPAPDMVIYLDMPSAAAQKLLESRSLETGVKKDIHEADAHHLEKAREAAMYVCEKWKWTRIVCGEGDSAFSREDIHGRVYAEVHKRLFERQMKP